MSEAGAVSRPKSILKLKMRSLDDPVVLTLGPPKSPSVASEGLAEFWIPPEILIFQTPPEHPFPIALPEQRSPFGSALLTRIRRSPRWAVDVQNRHLFLFMIHDIRMTALRKPCSRLLWRQLETKPSFFSGRNGAAVCGVSIPAHRRHQCMFRVGVLLAISFNLYAVLGLLPYLVIRQRPCITS